MNTPNFRGIFPPLPTPYHTDERVDLAMLRQVVRRLAPDVEGFVVNGTNGDFALLNREERRHTVEAVVAEAAGTRLVIAGTGAIATGEAIALTQDARAAGADAALVIAPYYVRPSAAGLYRHFADIAAAAPDWPILLYNFPQLVGQPIPVETIQALHADFPNIVGMKDTSGDMSYILQILESLPPDFQLLAGRGTVYLPALAAGAVGAILACANIIPARWQAVRRAFEANDWETARAGQYANQRVTRLIAKGGSLGVRAGLELLGLPIGPPRRPLIFEGIWTPADWAALRKELQV